MIEQPSTADRHRKNPCRMHRSVRRSLRRSLRRSVRRSVRLVVTALVLPAVAGPAAADPIDFEDLTAAAGIEFRHQNGMIGEKWIAEMMGAGAAAFDFDTDGRLDIWLIQGGPLPESQVGIRGRADTIEGVCDALFRNVSTSGALRFERVDAGICSAGYGMAIATGDIDNDGDTDVFVANLGANAMFENIGDGNFRDITLQSGVGSDATWSATATFFDKDGDGDLDLYVGNYVDFTVATHKVCRDGFGQPSYCSPSVYAASPDRLFENVGGGRFRDVSTEVGIIADRGPALGVVARDFDADGRTDLFVANDMEENFLWTNEGQRFENTALFAGAALNQDGNKEAGMGVAAADFDADCDTDLFLTHLNAQTNTLYANDGAGWFTDVSRRFGIAAGSLAYTGFGTGWLDIDNDGDLDLFIANGAVTALPDQPNGPLDLPLRQRNQLFVNHEGRYEEQRPIPGMGEPAVGRGVVFADFDNDGRRDLLITHNNDKARLYRNTSTPRNWLGVSVTNSAGATAIGATVRFGDSCRQHHVTTDGSYASAHDPRIVFGLGSHLGPVVVTVQWPDGTLVKSGPLSINAYHELALPAERPTPK